MRVTLRLMASLLLCVLALLAVDTYLIVRRDVQQYDRDMRRDAIHLGRILAEVVAEARQGGDDDRARDLVRRLGSGHETLSLRWAEVAGVGPDALPPGLAAADSLALLAGESVSFKGASVAGEDVRYTVVPLPEAGATSAALVIQESLREQAAQTRHTILRSLVLAGVVVVAGVVLMGLLGVHQVGRPLQQLVEKTERIGAGDLTGDLEIRGHHELSDLARAMNRMCDHLARARDEIRQKNEARLAALEQLRHAERLSMLGRLSSGLAHELGTPLNVVSGRARMIARGELDAGAAEASAEIIGAQADRMTGLVKRFLEYARRGESRRQPEDLTALAARSLDMLRPVAAKAGVELELVNGSPPPPALVDRVQLEQVIVNLVMNAVQAMPDGGTVRVVLDTDAAGRPLLRVEDEGVGIPAELLDQVCEPFFTTKHTGQGTGLGLSIVKGIVEDNGGELAIDSAVGRGTTIAVRLAREVEA